MFPSDKSKKIAILTVALSLILTLAPAPKIGAADHGDGPGVGVDRSADLNDIYLFLDPNDNTRVVMMLTVCGFIVPGEAVNFGVFDHNLRYRFALEANGDATPDDFIDVTFSEKVTSGATPQTATIKSTFFRTFTAKTTNPNLNPTPPDPVVTTDQDSGVTFFAGLVDDPFFFDIPAFNRFVSSVLAGQPNPGFFNRARDSFAGYNTLSIGLSVPVSLLRSRLHIKNDTLGLFCRTQRRVNSVSHGHSHFPDTDFCDDDDREDGRKDKDKDRDKDGPFKRDFFDVDRMGNPAVNVALIPFPRKNEYNLANTRDDAAGVFAGDIVATLTALGTNATNIGILAQVAVVRGDFLRLNLNQANSGPGGGNNTGAGFPNGRRLADDTIDTILFFVANQHPLGDNVNANDVPLRDLFPFFASPQQPRDSGVDDNTRN
ncbi:MAG TPA: DUF4331 family protein [Blastocatellia bacterium]|jgi:hypothetical protein|nr:DUF4331 family protein [Blastocatellia bacterium]